MAAYHGLSKELQERISREERSFLARSACTAGVEDFDKYWRRSNYKKIHKSTKIIYFLWQLCYV